MDFTTSKNVRGGNGMVLSRTGLARSRGAGVLAVALTLCALACWLSLAATSALATTTYPALSGHIGSPGSGEGQLSSPTGIAVNQSSGDVYVSDTGNNRIQEFTPSGTYIGQFNGSAAPTGALSSPEAIAIDNSGNALDPSNGDVYVVDRGHKVVDQFTASGAYLSQFKEVQGKKLEEISAVTTDHAGNLWIVGVFDIFEFSDTGSFIKEFPGLSDGNAPPSAAIDANENLYLLEYFSLSPLDRINPDGERSSSNVITTAMTINPSNNALFVFNKNKIDEYGPFGESLFGLNASREPVQTFGEGVSESYGMAVNAGGEGRFYATERGFNDVKFFDAVIKPTVAPEAASAVGETTTTLNGTVDPEALPVTSCHFEYGPTEAYGQNVPCEQAVGGGVTPVAVTAKLTGLVPNTLYHFRLAAANAEFGEAKSADATFITRGPLTVLDESVSEAASSSATLDAEVNPAHDVPTTYYFQYGTSAAYGTNVPAPPGAELRSGEGELEVGQHVQGLVPGTVYHYRFVGISEQEPGVFETVAGPDRTFTTQNGQASGLPDGREWELVSPPDKHGALIEQYEPEGAVTQAAIDGEAFTFITNAASETQPQGYTNRVQVLSLRESSGWSSRDVATPHEVATGLSVGHGQEYRFFSEDLSLGVVQPSGSFIPASSPHALAPQEASEQTAFLRTNFFEGNVNNPCLGSCFRPLVTGLSGHENVPPGTAFGEEGRCPPETECGPNFVGASPDAHHVILTSVAVLTSEPSTSGHQQLYEWSAGVPQAHSLSMVSVLPNGGAAEGASLGNLSFEGENARGAVSDDGSHVFFSTHDEHLYVRLNATQPQSPLGAKGECSLADGACTLQLDAVKSGTGAGAPSVNFQIASRDGSHVFFTDEQALTSESSHTGSDLYECEIVVQAGEPECQLSDLTPLHAGESAQVQGTIAGASDDGSWVYFVADGTLGVSGAVNGTCTSSGAPSEMCNLYASHDGESPRLVAVLTGPDVSDWATNLENLSTRVSPNGRWLAFMSQRELTGYDTRDALTGQHDAEVYLYDAQAEKVVCASCDPTGARPTGGREEGDAYAGGPTAAFIPGWPPYRLLKSRYQPPYLSNSGRLFFTSDGGLVPQDVNGTWDVYEYEPPGAPVGSGSGCVQTSVTFSSMADGCVGLISSGGSAEPSTYMGSSEDGGDVFFSTTAKLLSQDFDASVDVYDAHECTATAPCYPASEAQPPACITADSCRAAPTPQPSIFGTPASSTFSGVGNVAPPAPAGGSSKGTPKSLSRAQRLTRALHACKSKKARKQRVACERSARKRYGPAKAGGAKARKRGRG